MKALGHPLRIAILTILNDRMASPNELSKELDEGLSQVSYHVEALKDYGMIEMVKTEPRRGAVGAAALGLGSQGERRDKRDGLGQLYSYRHWLFVLQTKSFISGIFLFR